MFAEVIPAIDGSSTSVSVGAFGSGAAIALTQISRDPEDRAYYQRKLAEGRTKSDALTCLKRRISDRVYQTLRHQPPAGC